MRKNTTNNAGLSQTGITPKSLAKAVFSFNQKEKIMKNLRSFFVASMVMLAAFGIAAQSAFAQESYQQPTTVELDEFRQDLDQMMQEMYQVRETLRQNKGAREVLEKRINPRSAPALPQVRQQLQQMSYEEIAVVHKAFTAQFPGWREAPRELSKLANKIGRTGKTGDPSISPNAIIADNCQLAYDAAPSWADWSVARGIAIAADGVQNVVPPPFNGIATGVYIAAEESALTLEALNLVFERCSNDKDKTEILNSITTSKNEIVSNDNSNKTDIVNNDNSNRTTIVNNDNANALTINTNVTESKTTIVNTVNANTAAIINNDNANRTTIINNDNANAKAISDLVLRSQIEADLATESNGVKVAWYMTPTANGGKLDLVQQIVTLTLSNIRAAGGSIGNAQSFLDKANADKAAGNFKSAYDNYRKAYKAAAN